MPVPMTVNLEVLFIVVVCTYFQTQPQNITALAATGWNNNSLSTTNVLL